ncbi:hypothetical protein CY35_02G074800 [Sphagnum magellanicum]|nr:hypothetical protein CY35_02G074800 [Sphagnum magellanicum]
MQMSMKCTKCKCVLCPMYGLQNHLQTTHDIFVDSHLVKSLLDHTSTARSHVFNIYMVYTSKWKNIFISLHPSTQVI